MKTPTQAIIAYTELLGQHPERRDQMIQAISRNALRLQRLTNDILDVTRIESQTLNLHKEQFNLGDLIRSIVEDHRRQTDQLSSSLFSSPSLISFAFSPDSSDKSSLDCCFVSTFSRLVLSATGCPCSGGGIDEMLPLVI